MGSKLKKVGESSSDLMDKDTGEVVSSQNQSRYILQLYNQDFVFMYRKILTIISKLKETDIKVFVALSFDVDLQKHTFKSDQKLAEDIGNKLDISPKTFFNSISKLTKEGLIVRDSQYRGYYRIHPDYGWKGSQKDRPKELMVVLQQKLRDGDDTVIAGKGNLVVKSKYMDHYDNGEGFDVEEVGNKVGRKPKSIKNDNQENNEQGSDQ